MKEWKVSEAKAHFSEMLEQGVREPQVIYNRKRAVAAVLSIEEFERYQAYCESNERPRVDALLSELAVLNREEGELEIAPRENRAGSIPDFD